MDILKQNYKKNTNNLKHLLTAVYFIILGLILASMLLEYSEIIPKVLSFTFFLGMALTFFLKNTKLKPYLTVFMLLFFIWLNLSYPLTIGQVEEAYIFLPMMILCLYPGKLYSNFGSLVILIIMYNLIPDGHFNELVEDGIEVLLLNLFTSVLLLLYMRIIDKMQQYKSDSYTDYLTGLSNRKAFSDTLKDKYSAKNMTPFTLLTLDLDGFKKINDTLGHESGDLLLIELTERLKCHANDQTEVFRMNGDEFTILVEMHDQSAIEVLSSQILKDLSKDIKINNKSISVTGSIGIACYPPDGNSSTILVRNSNIAMSRAKFRGKNTFAFYDESMADETVKRYQIEEDLQNAIGTDQLSMAYQPKVNLSTGKISGAEALLRWNHPIHGNIPPVNFIEIAEESDLIIPIGRWIIDEVTRQTKLWVENGQRIRISFNVSAVQIKKDDLYKHVKTALDKYQLDSQYLEIEVTESMLMEDPDHYMEVLHSIRKLGVSISIDDFGIAYSSLNYLRHLPLDVLKIDREFVKSCESNIKDQMILKGIIDLGHNLELKLVAEGVEESTQKDFLASEGCDDFQGFLFSKPLVAQDFENLFSVNKQL